MSDVILSLKGYSIIRTIFWNLCFLLWFGAGYKLGWLAVGLCVFSTFFGFGIGAAAIEADLVKRGVLVPTKP